MASTHWALVYSERLYAVLLAIYPPDFRRDYQQEMLQTFRDCCRDALSQGGLQQILSLWGITFFDLCRSASIEHMIQLKKAFLPTEEYAMAQTSFSLTIAQRSDIGLKRSANEDNLITVLPEDPHLAAQKGALFVVADGMGGQAKGDIASEKAVTTIRDSYYQEADLDIPAALNTAIQRANRLLYKLNLQQEATLKEVHDKGMGTTCVAAVVHEKTLYIANVGDSLAYLVRDGKLQQLAENHSWTAEAVRHGILNQQEADAYGASNVITRSLGHSIVTNIYQTSYEVVAGDILVLCTDGLYSQVSESEIVETVKRYSPEESAQRLIDRANANGGPDNVTAVVVKLA
ncbi:PP2C family protein-serine/threonine phosphatase [Tengunoibacter tsumagoiensis]|uniref:PPM-type phosphatase domain-containing protein n=1 Tax=Tengunoibacter tsumagoiensis TaxID=2014871 RepID=A0A401ZX74_9CHLR|nr:protein phosphatase 2C domain-containing protein [Tengunoibacter tsumagoiensis]GCE11442.1 hypothetical protein KTT_13010 [Tengunoibacter tsumagoiensis]